ncbi:MAG: hypothetical protein Q9217_004901 [Psora testacea]
MGFNRKVLDVGNGTDTPKTGDTVRLEYTGYLFDESKGANNNMGDKFDSSKDRGDGVFKTAIGIGKVIKGWDIGILEMSVGERSILTISSDFAYGHRGFPDLIPPNSALVFDVKLLSINRKSEVALSAEDTSGIKEQGQLK